MAQLNETPNAQRIQIGVFGRVNTGKSSLINALTGQKTAIVSEHSGTTTDPVSKAMEFDSLGPVLFIDTAGFGDDSALGKERQAATEKVKNRCDIALLIISPESKIGADEEESLKAFQAKDVPTILVLNKADLLDEEDHLPGLRVSAKTGEGIDTLKQELVRLGSGLKNTSLLPETLKPGDVVLLVMPQDASAPKGRLILPQVQTTRELLDRHCIVLSIQPEELERTLLALKNPPYMIITDSQAFSAVYEKKPKETLLTSFSILQAAAKGDLKVFLEGAKAIEALKPGDRILIAESCTHVPKEEDIGRVQIPKLLEKKIGGALETEITVGGDFPEDPSGYALILQCGGCMVNRRAILSRIEAAKKQGVPITNYGIALAYLSGILEKVSLPV